MDAHPILALQKDRRHHSVVIREGLTVTELLHDFGKLLNFLMSQFP